MKDKKRCLEIKQANQKGVFIKRCELERCLERKKWIKSNMCVY